VKKIFAAVICLAVPGLLFLNAWQGYRYNELAGQVADLEKQQAAALDANRDVIAQIAYESSPERVVQKATTGLDVKPAEAGSITRLQVETAKRGGAGQ
jgi:ABC-type phosphate transport system auxiliary subunit